MTLTIDCRLYGLQHAGIGRYLLNLVPGLVNAYPKDHFDLILPKSYQKEFTQANVTVIISDIRHYSLKEQLLFPKVLNSTSADLYHFPHFNVPLSFNRPFVVTIHDLLWHETKDPRATTLSPLVHSLKYFGYQAVVRHAVTASKAIITPSQFVKNQILKHYPQIDPAKIEVIYEGVDKNLKSSVIRNPLSVIPDPYLLYVGSLYPHKNVEFVIKSLNGSRHLVIVSARNVFCDQLKTKVKDWDLASAVTFAGALPDSQLASVIKDATALVQPSLSEGFGLTGLEAMALGTPVLSASAGALPEVYGDAALYFDPHDLSDFLKALNSLTHHRPRLVKLGLIQCQKYSWQKTVLSTLELYNSIFTSSRA